MADKKSKDRKINTSGAEQAKLNNCAESSGPNEEYVKPTLGETLQRTVIQAEQRLFEAQSALSKANAKLIEYHKNPEVLESFFEVR